MKSSIARIVFPIFLLLTGHNLYGDQIGRKSCRFDKVGAVEGNSFHTGRPYSEYNSLLGGDLGRTIGRLNAHGGGHWIDMGTGEGKAQIWVLKKHPKIRCTGIAYRYLRKKGEKGEITNGPVGRALVEYRGRYRYLEGWFNKTRAKQAGKADLITDVFGIYNYTSYEMRAELLELYYGMLNPGGTILISSGDVPNKFKEEHPEAYFDHRNNGKYGWHTVIRKPTKAQRNRN